MEALLIDHPAVADVAVIGVPDERHGEMPVAVVVPSRELDPREVVSWTPERVAPYKRLRDVRVVDAIPRTPSGKIVRRRLAEHAAERVPALDA